MECPRCGFSNPVGAGRCEKCGATFELTGATATSVDVNRVSSSATPVTPTGGTSSVTAGAPAVAVTLQPGAVLGGRYEIQALIGEGGMGAVYKARDRELDRPVALKIIKPELANRPEILQRFKQELILARQVTHKNVIRIYDLGEADGIKFISMDFVEGRDLKSLVRERKKFPPEEAAEIVKQICYALMAAHAENVIHRDLKPQNIMLGADGKVTVMDFGIARSMESSGMTQTGLVVGTPEYMSPEQARAETLDGRADLYSLGIIFYELLTGRTPHHADSAIAILLKRTQEKPKAPTEFDPSLPPDMVRVVMKCLEIDPRRRYQTAKELVYDLDAATGGHAKGKTLHLRLVETITPRWISFSVAAGIAAFLLIVGVIVYRLKSPPTANAPHAPVSVLVADFTNHTGDPIFDDTLEPMVNVALEGASFINAYNRGTARKLAGKLPHPTDKLDEQSARLVAVSQGISAVITGELARRGDSYSVSASALDAVSGNVLAQSEVTAANKDQVLLDIPKLVAPLRKALGDTTPESVQVEKAAGAFTAANLEVVHQYGIAVEQLFAGNMEEALKSYSKAVALDPNFARAYAGMAAAYGNMGKAQEAEKDVKLAMEHVDRMTERERYRVRGFYYYTTGNWPKCVEEYGELLKRFPADNVGQGNVAGCYLHLRKFPEAVAAARQAVAIVPKGAMQRVILSLDSSYNGDFAAGEKEARTALELNPSFPAYLALVEAQLGEGQMAEATETYHNLAKVNPLGASLAASGLADVAAYEGRFADAARILEEGAAADLAAKNPDNAAEKLATLAHWQAWRGQKGPAVEAATKASGLSQAVSVRVLAAETFAETGDTARAQKLAAGLAAETEPESQAYARMIEGGLALRRGQANEAIKLFGDANSLLDTWLGHLELARAYLAAGLFVEADSEIDRCLQRRGEALEVFMDNVPTIAFFPSIYYYQGRVREGLKSPGFAEPYRTYLSIRGKSTEDPLVPEIRRRIGR